MTEKVILGRLLCAQFVQTEYESDSNSTNGTDRVEQRKKRNLHFSLLLTQIFCSHTDTVFSRSHTYTHTLESICMSLHGVYCIENDMRKRDRSKTYCARSELYSEE